MANCVEPQVSRRYRHQGHQKAEQKPRREKREDKKNQEGKKFLSITKFFCLPSTTVTFIILVLKRIFLSFHQLDTFLYTLYN